MMRRQRRDLRVMGDDQHLRARRQTRKPGAHRVRHRPADPGVDLVEDQAWNGMAIRQHDAQRQHEPREFAARRDPLQGAAFASGAGGDAEAYALGAVRARGRAEACHLDREAGGAQPQRGELAGNLLAQGAGRAATALAKALRGAFIVRPGLRGRGAKGVEAAFAVADRVEAPSQGSGDLR